MQNIPGARRAAISDLARAYNSLHTAARWALREGDPDSASGMMRMAFAIIDRVALLGDIEFFTDERIRHESIGFQAANGGTPESLESAIYGAMVMGPLKGAPDRTLAAVKDYLSQRFGTAMLEAGDEQAVVGVLEKLFLEITKK